MIRQSQLSQMNEPDTVVITQVCTLKDAIIGWFDDEMKKRSKESEDIMLDQAVVMKRLGKSRATLGFVYRPSVQHYILCIVYSLYHNTN